MSHCGVVARQDDVIKNTSDFDIERPRLTALATRILGSAADADDVVQEAWLRFTRADGIEVLSAWLTTVVTRLCLDLLRQRRTRPVTEDTNNVDSTATDPEADALLVERVGDAVQVVLDTLAPAERVALVMHDVFGFPFDEIGVAMGRSSTAVRQLASRARHKVQGGSPRDEMRTASDDSRRVVAAFLAAARGGDVTTLMSLLAPDAVIRADAAAQSMGAESSYDGAVAVATRFNGAKGAVAAIVDGELGAAWIQAGIVKVAFVFHVVSGIVCEIEQIADPEVLSVMDIHRVRLSPPPPTNT